MDNLFNTKKDDWSVRFNEVLSKNFVNDFKYDTIAIK